MERFREQKFYNPKEVASALFEMGTIHTFINGVDGVIRLGEKPSEKTWQFFSTYSIFFIEDGTRKEKVINEALAISKEAIFTGFRVDIKKELLAIFIDKYDRDNSVK